jgi:hypothetical protein
VLVVVNAVLLLLNQSTGADITSRQQYINQSAQLGRVNQVLIQTLAASAATNKDARLTDLLSRQGILYSFTPNATAQAPSVFATAPGVGAPAAAAPAPAPARRN